MASVQGSMKIKNEQGKFDNVYIESKSELVKRPDGSSVEESLDNYLPEVQDNDNTPTSLSKGKILVGNSKVWVGGENNVVEVTGDSKVTASGVTSTELSYLSGVTSNIQTQLNGKSPTSHTHNYAGSSSVGGVANSATKLATARTLTTNLGSTTGASFNGTTNASIGVTGTLPIANGGTGATTAAAALTNLGITATATELNYVDGVTSNIQTQLNGKSPTSHTHNYAGSSSVGGVANSATKLATARTLTTNLGSTTGASFNGTTNASIGVTGTLPIANGGTGATTAAAALTNLGITATATELNYVDGVTSNVQTQLNSKAVKSKIVTATLTVRAWSSSKTQKITVSGLGASANGIIGLSQSATSTQREAARNAFLSVTAQAANSLTITCDNVVPTVDIPVYVIILG